MRIQPFRTLRKYDAGKTILLPKLHHAEQLGGQGGTLTFRANDKNHGCSRLRSNFISAGARSTSNAVIKSHGSFNHRKIT